MDSRRCPSGVACGASAQRTRPRESPIQYRRNWSYRHSSPPAGNRLLYLLLLEWVWLGQILWGQAMGWIFDIEHANLVNYLTIEKLAPSPFSREVQPTEAPRTTYARLDHFLRNLGEIGSGPGIISSSSSWIRSLENAENDARHRLVHARGSIPDEFTDLSSETVAQV